MFVRYGGRIPAEKFLEDCEKRLRKQFFGSFGLLLRQGSDCCHHTRFKPMHRDAIPLWEFKEHDHRLYCVREAASRDLLRIVLLSGWVKDKSRGRQENNEIETAKKLYREYEEEKKGAPK